MVLDMVSVHGDIIKLEEFNETYDAVIAG